MKENKYFILIKELNVLKLKTSALKKLILDLASNEIVTCFKSNGFILTHTHMDNPNSNIRVYINNPTIKGIQVNLGTIKNIPIFWYDQKKLIWKFNEETIEDFYNNKIEPAILWTKQQSEENIKNI